jgi:hypothetical protein
MSGACEELAPRARGIAESGLGEPVRDGANPEGPVRGWYSRNRTPRRGWVAMKVRRNLERTSCGWVAELGKGATEQVGRTHCV